MTDLTPTSGKAEIHIQYECNLACRNCNRMSFLQHAHTPPMTLADMDEFTNQARALKWYPGMLLIGGEPTLHPDFFDFVERCCAYRDEGIRHGFDSYAQLWSNQQTPEIRERVDHAEAMGMGVVRETAKDRSMILSIYDMYVSPLDLGLGQREPCWQHASQICGISVDSRGYSLCACGGAVDGILGLGFRTKDLASLFDPAEAQRLTDEMCGHCGHNLHKTGMPGCDIDQWNEKVDAMPPWHGMKVSPTWQAAFAGRKIGA